MFYLQELPLDSAGRLLDANPSNALGYGVALFVLFVGVLIFWRMFTDERKRGQEMLDKERARSQELARELIKTVELMTQVKLRLDDSRNQGMEIQSIRNTEEQILDLLKEIKELLLK